MTIRVIINGAFGKMGSAACQTLSANSAFAITATLGSASCLATELKTHQADIVLDLTRADCAYKNATIIINAGIRPVIGTSGLTATEITTLQHLCNQQNLGGLIVPNFSIGAILMMRFAAEAARLLPDVEIIEGHHPQKWDAPSGTAIKTAELIAAARQTTKPIYDNKSTFPGARGANVSNIPIHALRLPGMLAQQEVIFGHMGETLSISHHTLDRQAFMPGIVMACHQAMSCNELHYGLDI